LRGIVYIPEAATRHIGPSSRNNSNAFQAEFERLAVLQVPWACAILAYKALLMKSDGTRDVEKALSLCAGPAQAADPYALYVLSRALQLKCDLTAAAVAMRRSSKQSIPPRQSWIVPISFGTRRPLIRTSKASFDFWTCPIKLVTQLRLLDATPSTAPVDLGSVDLFLATYYCHSQWRSTSWQQEFLHFRRTYSLFTRQSDTRLLKFARQNEL
jgi:hypothetical protein